MPSPSVDIIVPVWNSPFETRQCLAAIISHSPEARLIVVDNGSSRETELMLEEFSEVLDEQALFIKSDKNVGLVKAVNIGLKQSSSDFAVIVRPQVIVTSGWLADLIDAAGHGLSVPSSTGSKLEGKFTGVSRIETTGVSFSTLAIKKSVLETIGYFDEELDGAEWCLHDYSMRAAVNGYRIFLSLLSKVKAGPEPVFGSEERLMEISRKSRLACLERWGSKNHYVIYFGRIAENERLQEAVEVILKACRLGHRFTLLLHGKQTRLFIRSGWNLLHMAISLQEVSAFFTAKSISGRLEQISLTSPEAVVVEGTYGALKNIVTNVTAFESVLNAVSNVHISEH
jgi:hypothetical protein